MNDNSDFLELPGSCDAAVDWLMQQMTLGGLRVMRTFDLQSARHVQDLCPCPYHGTEQCDCQMVVLLVYQLDQGPITIVAHGHDQRTWISLVDTPQQRPDHRLEALIRRLFTTYLVSPIYE